MVEYEIDIPPSADLSQAAAIIEECYAAVGLRMTLKGTLAKYPGCVYWHFRKDNQRGTLEITLWNRARRIWFTVQSKRSGPWIEESIGRIKQAVESRLATNDA